MAEPTLAEKVSVLQRQLNLPEGANLVDKVEKALEKIGLADELRGQPLTRKVDAALQTLGVTPQTSVPMGTPVSNAPVTAPLPTVVEARVVQEAEEQARREAEQARERALRHEKALENDILEKALRDAMPGWFALWTPWTDRKHAALETAIAHAEAATPPEGSTLFAALNEAKEAARRGRGELDAKREAEEKARREAEALYNSAARMRARGCSVMECRLAGCTPLECSTAGFSGEELQQAGYVGDVAWADQIQPTGCCAIL